MKFTSTVNPTNLLPHQLVESLPKLDFSKIGDTGCLGVQGYGIGKYQNPLVFFAGAIGFSWFFWGISFITRTDARSLPGIILIGLGGLGPVVSAIFTLLWGESCDTWKDFWKRLLLFRSGSWKPWFLLLALPLFFQVFSILVSVLLGSPASQLLPREEVRSPLKVLPFAFFVLLFGPLPEELGWRGYGLPALFHKVPAITASGLLACFWALWHLPLFFIPGYPLAVLLQEPVRFLFYLLDFLPNSLLYTWLFFSVGGSTAAAILFHWGGNFWGMMFETGTQAEGIALILKTGFAFFVLKRWNCEMDKPFKKSTPSDLRSGGLVHRRKGNRRPARLGGF